MSTARLVSASILALTATACSVPTTDVSPDQQKNACQQTDECGGGLCVPVDASGTKACVAQSASIGGLLLEVRPPAESAYGAGASFLIDVSKALKFAGGPNGAIADLDLVLDDEVHVDSALSIDFAWDCGAKGNVAADLQFTTHPKYRGLSTLRYIAKPSSQGTNESQIDLPPGDYDVYAVPKPVANCKSGPLPPVFLASVPVDRTTGQTLHVGLAKPVLLTGSISFAPQLKLDGWHVDLLDRQQGHVVSADQTLAPAGGQVSFQLSFFYFGKGKEPILRLRPPDGVSQPTVLWDSATFMVDGDNVTANLTLSGLAPSPRKVSGSIEGEDGTPLTGVLRFKSESFMGSVSNNSFFETAIETTTKGTFETSLPPGTYQVAVTPYDHAHATLVVDLPVPEDTKCFCGKTFQLPALGALSGQVRTAHGDALKGAMVEGTPFLPAPSTYLAQKLTTSTIVPRSANTQTAAAGDFSIGLDVGKFDLAVRPESRTRFPWFVSPRVAVTQAGDVTALDTMNLQNPAIVRGVVRDPRGTPIPQALVAAWVPLDADTIVQIGEAVSSSDAHAVGGYSLPLPPTTTP